MKKFFALLIVMSFLAMPIKASAAINNDMLYSVVQIYSYKDHNGTLLLVGSGSGSYISQDGLILTNYHVISDELGEPLDDFEICYLSNEYEPPICDEYAAIVTYHAGFDLALLAPYARYDFDIEEWDFIPADDGFVYSPVTFSTTEYDPEFLPALRDEVSIVGYPAASLTGNINITNGNITSYRSYYFEELDETFIISLETDALINPGNSGGAAFDSNDRFVGIPSAISIEGVSGQYGYIIPATIINSWLDFLVEEGFLNFNPNVYVYGDTQIALEDILVQGGVAGTDLSQLGQDQILFLDLDSTHANYDAIAYLKQNKIIGGYLDGTFLPEGDITRAELMKILALATGVSPDPDVYKNCFPDVAEDWYAKYVCYAKEQGWVQGYPDNTFKPGNNVVKAEAIKMTLNTQGVILDGSVTANPYNDVSKDDWFALYVQTAKNLGVLEEEGILYRPADNSTRAGVSENIYRVVK